MATRTNPLISAAVLTSTAAIAVATPAFAPSVQLPSPHALAAAKVQLTTFADLLSITATDWSNVLFGGYGEAISPNQDPDFDWAAAYISPFTRCDFSCTVNGPSGIAYLALDALINGNGTGYAPVLQDPTKPYNETTNPYVGGYPTWSVGAVNYYFEGGPGPGTAYLVAQPFGDPNSPLYNPAVASIITQAFNGLANVTTFYVAGLTTLATLANQIPTVGPYIYGAINAYLGPNTSDEFFGDWGYAAGLSGILRYISDVITSGGNPLPPYGPQTSSAAATLAAAAVPAAAATVVDAPKVEAAPASAAVKDSAPVDVKTEAAPAVSEAKASAPASEVKVSAPAVAEVKDSAPAVSTPEVKVPEVKVDLSDLKDSAPAVTPKGQVSGGVESAAEKAASTESAGASTGADTSAAAAKDNAAPKADVTPKADAAPQADTGAGAADAGADKGGADSASAGSAGDK